VDVVIHNKDSTEEFTIQIIVSLNSKSIPFGDVIDNLAADFVVICTSVENMDPESNNYVHSIPNTFILTKNDIKKSIIKRSDDEKTNYWLEESSYLMNKNKWEKIGFA